MCVCVQVKRLTADIEVILEAIKVSDSLQLDESGSKVKANSKRCVLLVRGIPQDTAEEVGLSHLALIDSSLLTPQHILQFIPSL